MSGLIPFLSNTFYKHERFAANKSAISPFLGGCVEGYIS